MSTILIIDDEKDIRNLLATTLEYEGYDVLTVDSGMAGLRITGERRIHIAICDVKLPDMTGIEVTRRIKELSGETEVICLTAFGKIHDGVQAIKNGAFDYLIKGDDDNKLIPLISKAEEKSRLQFRIKELEDKVSKKYDVDQIISNSPLIRDAVAMVKKVAASEATILLTGQTGTGKEVFAQSIYSASSRKNQSFVAVNCSAFGKDLLESELFGYKAGAFTGAAKDKRGLFEEANHGTIFLDEIGELNLDLQAKLLRVLETGTFFKLGDTRETKVNVRVIAATNRNLEEEIQQGKFREDLFYRLSVFHIKLPVLNDRKEDIPLLTEQFAAELGIKTGKRIKAISGEYMEALKKHRWRGNIRELRNIVERSVILCEGDTLTADLLPVDFVMAESGVLHLRGIKREHIKKVLEYTNGNKTKSARLMGISVPTLYRMLKKYHIID